MEGSGRGEFQLDRWNHCRFVAYLCPRLARRRHHQSARNGQPPPGFREMKPDDPNIKWIAEPQLGLAGRMYVPLVAQGLTTTLKHIARSLRGEVVTLSYPDEEPQIENPQIYRGVHRLNKDAAGRVKCVACFLCATACPAHCIDIIAEESPWPDREKYPQSFSIDELRCIYCGMCEE